MSGNIQSSFAYSYVGSATLAEINAGTTLIKGVTGKKIRVIDATLIMDGTFTTATSINLGSDADTPVVVEALAIAGASDGAVIKTNDTNVTLGVGFLASLGIGDGLQIYHVGSAAAGGTSVTVQVLYELVSG